MRNIPLPAFYDQNEAPGKVKDDAVYMNNQVT